MNFASPHVLWHLLWIPFFAVLVLGHERQKNRRFLQFAQRGVWSQIVPERIPYAKTKKSFVLLLALSFFILALSRPQFGSHDETVHTAGLDIMIVLDVSSSMNVEDVVPSRLKSAKHVIRSLVERLEGDRVGMVAFAGSAYVACPLTTDLSYLMQTVQIVSSKTIQAQGTDIEVGVDTAIKALERGAQEEATTNPSANTLPSHVLILISDGEDHDGSGAQAVARAKAQGIKVYVLGVGTEKGGPIPVRDASGNLQTYKKDAKGQPIVSTFSPESLSGLAKEASGKYWSITPGEQEVQELIEDLGSLVRGEHGRHQFRVYEDRFQIPLLIGILLLLIELFIPLSKKRSGSRGVKLSAILLLLYPFLNTYAQDKTSAPLQSYLENKKGLEAFKAGKIEEAQKSFGAAQARDPTRAELQFNQGVVQYEGGDIDRAVEAFQGAAKSSSGKGDTHLYGKSLYNLGNAQTKKGNIREAVRGYLGAIQAAQSVKDETLENEARKNLELLLSQVKQQKQDKKEDQKKDQKDDKKDSDQQSESKQSEDQKSKSDSKEKKSSDSSSQPEQKNQEKAEQKEDPSDSKKDEKKNPSEPEELNKSEENKADKEGEKDSQGGDAKKSRKQPFRSQKMKPEDADRVMAELSNRERELQEKLQTQNIKPQPHRKDW